MSHFPRATAGELQEHITSTYFSLRAGMGVIAFLFPLLLVAGGYFVLGLPLQPSISDYYHGAMRNWFVGVLFALGSFLYLYRGYSARENLALNLAGILSLVIALLPSRLLDADHDTVSRLHGIAAVLFFLCIAYIAIFRASDTLPLVSSGTLAHRYDRVYRVLGIIMALSPLLAALVAFVTRPAATDEHYVLILEVIAIWTFAAFWWVKSMEIHGTHADQRVAECELERDDRGNVLPEGADAASSHAQSPQARAVAALAALLPESVGGFSADGPAVPLSLTATGLRAERRYSNADRAARIELHTGRVDALRKILLEDGERAMLSDTPTRWRTESVRGLRVRIAEDPTRSTSSRAYIGIGENVVGVAEVRPRSHPGESARLFEELDLEAIGRAGMAPLR